MLQRKGAYFYVIDAFIASIIILGALVVLFSQFTNAPNSKQAYYTAEDFISALESTPVRNIDDPLVRTWLTNGTITTPDISALQQIGVFNLSGNSQNAQTLSRILADQTAQNVGLEVLLNGQRLYIRETRPQSSADNLLSARRVLLLRKNTTALYPPAILEVRTWQ